MGDLPKAIAQRAAAELELEKEGWGVVRRVVEAEAEVVRERLAKEAQG